MDPRLPWCLPRLVGVSLAERARSFFICAYCFVIVSIIKCFDFWIVFVFQSSFLGRYAVLCFPVRLYDVLSFSYFSG